MEIKDERLQRTVNICIEKDKTAASRFFNVDVETISRYLRLARERGIVPTEEVVETLRPNVLVLDIETSLMSFFGWSPGKQYVGPGQIITDWYTLSWAVKWLLEPDVYSDVITSKESLARDDERIIRSIWDFLDKADIIIIHNARFDVRKLNAKFIYYEMPPPSPYRVVDTLTAMRKEALFSSNKQDELCKKMGLRRKVEHEGYDLWIKCFYGDTDALLKMEEYDRGDVLGLEELYLRIRAYIKSHPNMNLFVEGDGNGCPNCGSDKIRWMDKMYSTNVNQYSCFRCRDCGAVGRSRTASRGKDDRVRLTSVAR